MEETIEPGPGARLVEGPVGPIWMEDPGIIIVVNNGNKEHTLEEAKYYMGILDDFRKNATLPLLIDFTRVKNMSRDVREYYTSPEITKKVSAVAIMSRSVIGRMVGNFFIGINRTQTPTRLFGNYEEAVQWLKTFI